MAAALERVRRGMRGWRRRSRAAGVAVCVALAAAGAHAAPAARPGAGGEADPVERWVARSHDASRNRNFAGTLVVVTPQGMTSARVWHLCEGAQRIERVDALTGAPRSVLRRDGEVTTVLREQRFVRVEQRDAAGLFPNLRRVGVPAVAQHYRVRALGQERVAGLSADVVEIAPRDALRNGYRLWAERRSGLALQLQTISPDGRVLEQAGFSQLDINPALRREQLLAPLADATGWRVERPQSRRVEAGEEGWSLRAPVAGFEATGCFQRAGAAVPGALQWVFSDGLATVSLFLEPAGPESRQELATDAGAVTQMLAQRVAGDWWLTAVGEVPQATLRAFAAALQRTAQGRP